MRLKHQNKARVKRERLKDQERTMATENKNNNLLEENLSRVDETIHDISLDGNAPTQYAGKGFL